MAFLAKVFFDGDGASSGPFTIPFPYISEAHIVVRVDTVLQVLATDYEFTTPTTITFLSGAPAVGTDNIEFRRITPSVRLIDFADGNVLTEAKLDKDSNQLAFLTQETIDFVNSALIDGGGVSTPSDPADDDKVIRAVGGTFGWFAFLVDWISDTAAFMKTFLKSSTALVARGNLGAAGLVDANTFTAEQTLFKAGIDARLNLRSDQAAGTVAKMDLVGQDDGANDTVYARIAGVALTATDTLEDGRLAFQTMVGGSLASTFNVAKGIWTGGATGGDKGIDTMNATEFFVNGVPIGAPIATGSTTARLLADRFAEVFNAKDYGAVGDGVADDEVAIQAAIDAAGTAGGGIVWLPQGTYIVAGSPGSVALSLTNDNVFLLGAGPGVTTIKLKTGSDNHTVNIAGITGGGVSNLTIDGQRVLQTAGHGIRADGTRLRFSDLEIIETDGYGMGLAQNASSSLKDVRLQNITIRNTGNDGIDMKNTNDDNHGIVLDNILVDDFDLAGLGNRAGLDIRGVGCVLSNIVVRGVGRASGNTGIRFRTGELAGPAGLGAHGSSLSSFAVFGDGAAATNGVSAVARDCSISNGYVQDCRVGVSLADTLTTCSNVVARDCLVAGFQITDVFPADRCSFINCRADACATGFDLRNVDDCLIMGCRGEGNTVVDLLIAAGAQSTMVHNSSFLSTNKVTDNGTGTLIRNNTGHVTENAGTAIIASGTTSLVVSHGLSVTPGLADINIVLGEGATNDPGNIWISAITATQFTVNSRNDPGASNLSFGWQVIAL